MPSDAAKKRQAKKKAAAQSRGKPKQATNGLENGKSNGDNGGSAGTVDLSARSCTGVLASHPESKDVKIENFSITFHGVELLVDTKLELNSGRRYGFVGLNGCGEWVSSSSGFSILSEKD